MEELKSQISQMKLALACASEEDKLGLQMMIEELEKLAGDGDPLKTNEELLNGAPGGTHDACESKSVLSKEDEEFRLFQEELAALENDPGSGSGSSSSEPGCSTSGFVGNGKEKCNEDEPREAGESELETSFANEDLQNELAALEGMKCKAPFEHHWGQVGYYNAVVLSVEDNECESLDTILVRVLFIQPVSQSMQPCPFFMENRCRFEGKGCKFSHGEIVSLAQLKEYVEPDFSNVGTGSRVMAKYSDGLWYKGTISEISESGNCDVKYDSYKEIFTIPLHETLPLYHDDQASSSSAESDSSSSDTEDGSSDEMAISNPLLFQMKATGPLGEWEKYTKGIGSKLMAKMGYVVGTGLGRRGEGRIEPVDAVVLPRGRSLDACMELKEKAGSENIFSVEKRMKRIKRKEAQRVKNEEVKRNENESVFKFLNTKLSIAKSNHHHLRKNVVHTKDLNKETSKNLNKKMLNLGENIKQANKDIAKLKESMKRHEGRDVEMVNRYKSKLASMEDHLNELKKSEVTIESEQRHRSDKKKLSIF